MAGISTSRIQQNMKPGQWYQFEHTSKGTFVAKLLGIKTADASDEVDELLLNVAIPTGQGSGQERIQPASYYNEDRAKRKVPLRIMLLRPSKIQRVTAASQPDIDKAEPFFVEFEVMKNRPTVMPAPQVRRHGQPQTQPTTILAPPEQLPTVQRRGKFKTLLNRALRRD